MVLLLLSPRVAVDLAVVQRFIAVEFLRIRYEVSYREHTLAVMWDITRRSVSGSTLTSAQLRWLTATI